MFYICIDTNRYDIGGVEAAWEAYNKAVAFAEIVGVSVDLCDAETDEVIASTWQEPVWDGEDDPEVPYDLDMGFNPYMGMYDFDC